MSTAVAPEGAISEEQTGPARGTVLFLIFTIFLNAMGITIIAPVTPFIVQQYLGNSNSLPIVVAWLTAIYSVCQFIATPGLGVLSDRFGRRPLTLFCLLGSAVGYCDFSWRRSEA